MNQLEIVRYFGEEYTQNAPCVEEPWMRQAWEAYQEQHNEPSTLPAYEYVESR